MLPKSKSVQITSACAIVTALSTGMYQAYGAASETLSSYAKKEDILELKLYVENLRRGMSLELLNTTIMGYEDDLMVLEFEIENKVADASARSTKSNIDRRITDLKQKRNILRVEISTNKKKLKL